MYTLCYISYTHFFFWRSSTVLLNFTYYVNSSHWKLLHVHFGKIRYIHRQIPWKRSFNTVAIYRRLTQADVHVCVSQHYVSVQPVWPIVVHGKMLLHISVLCPTATKLLPHLRRGKPRGLFCDFQNCKPATLPVRCWYYILQEATCFPKVFSPIHRKTTPCDTLKMNITMFLTAFFYEFYLFFPLNLILRFVLFSPSPPHTFISTLNWLSRFQNVSHHVVHCQVSAQI